MKETVVILLVLLISGQVFAQERNDEADSLLFEGMNSLGSDNLKSAYEKLSSARLIYHETGNSKGEYLCLTKMAFCAKECNDSVLNTQVHEAMTNLADSIYDVGRNYCMNRRYKLACDKFSEAKLLYKYMKKPEYEYYCLCIMSLCAIKSNDTSSAIKYYNKALELANSI